MNHPPAPVVQQIGSDFSAITTTMTTARLWRQRPAAVRSTTGPRNPKMVIYEPSSIELIRPKPARERNVWLISVLSSPNARRRRRRLRIHHQAGPGAAAQRSSLGIAHSLAKIGRWSVALLHHHSPFNELFWADTCCTGTARRSAGVESQGCARNVCTTYWH